jgi:hypothetical protein
MASIAGGTFGTVIPNQGGQPSGQTTSGGATHLSLANISSSGNSSVPGGFDSVVGPEQSGSALSKPPSTDQSLVQQTQDAGNTVLHMPDGSSIVILGTTHIDTSFSH